MNGAVKDSDPMNGPHERRPLKRSMGGKASQSRPIMLPLFQLLPQLLLQHLDLRP